VKRRGNLLDRFKPKIDIAIPPSSEGWLAMTSTRDGRSRHNRKGLTLSSPNCYDGSKEVKDDKKL